MAGLSSKALNFGNVESKQKFVGQELDEELDVNWYQFKFRDHDPQIGRFLQIDPLADKYVYNSTFAYAENMPINGIDLEGLEFFYTANGALLGQGPNLDSKNVYITTQDIVNSNTSGENSAVNWGNVMTAKGTIDFTGLTSVNNDLLVAFAAVIDLESSGARGESYAIANVTMNYLDNGGSRQLKTLEDVVLYDNTFAQGATQANYTSFLAKTADEKNQKFAMGAAINAIGKSKCLAGEYSDYSNGATGWDGLDLISTKWTNSHRNYSWSTDSKSLVEQYKKDNNGGVDVSKWTYVDTGYNISAKKIVGKTLFQKLEGTRGEKKQSTTKFR